MLRESELCIPPPWYLGINQNFECEKMQKFGFCLQDI